MEYEWVVTLDNMLPENKQTAYDSFEDAKCWLMGFHGTNESYHITRREKKSQWREVTKYKVDISGVDMGTYDSYTQVLSVLNSFSDIKSCVVTKQTEWRKK